MSQGTTRTVRILAWALGGGGAVACAATIGLTAAAGLLSAEILLYPTFIAFGLLGALIAARHPGNSIGWLMCLASLAAVLLFLPLDYGYSAQVARHGSWPFGGEALWIGAWAWIPLIGLFLPLLTVRFPDGNAMHRWRAVNWLAAAGTAAATLAVVLSPPDILVDFLLLPPGRQALVTPGIHNPLGSLLPGSAPRFVIFVGVALILLAYAMSLASVIDRFRRARATERLQLKWFAYAGLVIGLALVYGTITSIAGAAAPGVAEVALHISFFALPLAIAVAILRYRLYDIDVIINRSLVYGAMTAIVTAAYTASVTLFQRLSISISGQKSDAAYVLTAFGIVVGFSPVKDWLQRLVDARVGGRNSRSALDGFTSRVDAVVSVLDVERVGKALLDEAVTAFNAAGGALYLQSAGDSTPVCSHGRVNDGVGIEVPLRFEGQRLGRLVLGTRRGDVPYSERDRIMLQRSADSAAEALALAAHLGFRPLHVRGDASRG